MIPCTASFLLTAVFHCVLLLHVSSSTAVHKTVMYLFLLLLNKSKQNSTTKNSSSFWKVLQTSASAVHGHGNTLDLSTSMGFKQREHFGYLTLCAFRIHLGLQNCNCEVASISDICVEDFH